MTVVSYRWVMPRHTYAVVWEQGGAVFSGGLTIIEDGFELRGREQPVSVEFADVREAEIARGAADRLRGMPALLLRLKDGALLRVASLEGVGALHELAGRVESPVG